MFRTTQIVSENERVLVFKNQVMKDVLLPGKHQLWDLKQELNFIRYDINELFFSEPNVERLYRDHDVLKPHIFYRKLQPNEVGLLYINGLLRGIVAPGEHLYLWQDAGDIRLDTLAIDQNIEVDEQLMFLIKRAGANSASRLIRSVHSVATQPIAEVVVAREQVGLLYIDGQFSQRLSPGQYAFWQFNHAIELKALDCRTQMIEISGQEILSKDRVTLRINLTASIKIKDAELVATSVEKVDEYIYKTLQLALRESVGTKALDDFLLDKLYVNETVKELVAGQLDAIGVTLVNVGVKDIILPGEMKAILNQVVEAQKAAEANVIKRREETSATRSLHNTAKVMENNPTLMRLKELEALEKVAERIGSLTVFNGLDGLTNGLIKIG